MQCCHTGDIPVYTIPPYAILMNYPWRYLFRMKDGDATRLLHLYEDLCQWVTSVKKYGGGGGGWWWWWWGSQYKDVVLQKYMYRDPHVKDKTVFNMGISIPQKEGLYIETGPRTFSTYVQIPHAGVLELQLSGALVAHELRSNIKTVFPYMGNSIIKIRWPWDSLFFIMGIPVRHLYIETAAWILEIQFADNRLKICLFRWQRYLKVILFSFYPP